MRDCFPTSAWRTLGLLPLPGKAACGVDIVLARLESLRAILPLDAADSLSHDELQALVARLAGVPSTRATQRASPSPALPRFKQMAHGGRGSSSTRLAALPADVRLHQNKKPTRLGWAKSLSVSDACR
jgi:hypothetical protein